MPPWMILGTFMLMVGSDDAALGARSATLCIRLAGEAPDCSAERCPVPAKGVGEVKAAAMGKHAAARTDNLTIISPPLFSHGCFLTIALSSRCPAVDQASAAGATIEALKSLLTATSKAASQK